jgi:hypothetical protein
MSFAATFELKRMNAPNASMMNCTTMLDKDFFQVCGVPQLPAASVAD